MNISPITGKTAPSPRNSSIPSLFWLENWFDARGDDRRRDDETKNNLATNQFSNEKNEGMELCFGDGAPPFVLTKPRTCGNTPVLIGTPDRRWGRRTTRWTDTPVESDTPVWTVTPPLNHIV